MAGTPVNALNIDSTGITYFNGPDFTSITNGTVGQVLTANVSGAPTFQAAAGGSGIVTIDGDSGSVTGATISMHATPSSGSSVSFDGSGTTLSFNVTDVLDNTLIGQTAGNGTLTGTSNTGIGFATFNALTSGIDNCAIGYATLDTLTEGNANMGIGKNTLSLLKTGSYNVGVGDITGSSYTGAESNNILFNSPGVISDSNVLRIGTATGAGTQELSKAFISGINGVTNSSAAIVTTDTTTDQMGTVPYIKNGTFTPILVGSSTAGTTTYSIQSGFYSQIGNMVFVQGFIDVTSATGTGGILIGDFPVASNSQADGYAIGSIYWDGDNTWPWGSASTTICIQNGPGDNFVYPVVFGSGTSPDFGIVQMGTGRLTVQFSITYTV